ncbi:MAG TPA: DinB family protein [Anaerolineales bacterium]|nr:DinB family protein [Anaerolineales bacterium]
MDANRKLWNAGQQTLRRALASNQLQVAIGQFLIQHAMVHSLKVSHMDVWSFEDELWQGLPEKDFRAIPPKGEHSIAWILFHMARIEDMTMNMLVAGTHQLYSKDNWEAKLRSTIHHSANAMSAAGVADLSMYLDMKALREYRLTVGRRTRAIIKKLKLEELTGKVDPIRLKMVREEGAVIPEAMGIVNYWGNRTIAGLLLMPPTRHNFLHLNEAMRLKQKLQ